MENYRRFLQPEVVAKLAGIDIKARLVVEGFLSGLHRSPYHGFSVEFAEYRQYMPGDEIKRVDWKVYGRTYRYYVKEYEEETNLKAYLLLDASRSMAYKSGEVDKVEYGSCLAAALAYLLLHQQDAVGLLIFDVGIRTYIPPRAVKVHLNTILRELESLKPMEKTNVGLTLHELAERLKRRGLIILISDLFDDFGQILSGLKHFRHKKHEVIVFHILDRFEREFPFERDTVFKDLESGEEIFTQPGQIRQEYRKNIQAFTERYKRECREERIDYVPLDTSTPYDYALFAYLSKRRKLG